MNFEICLKSITRKLRVINGHGPVFALKENMSKAFFYYFVAMQTKRQKPYHYNKSLINC